MVFLSQKVFPVFFHAPYRGRGKVREIPAIPVSGRFGKVREAKILIILARFNFEPRLFDLNIQRKIRA